GYGQSQSRGRAGGCAGADDRGSLSWCLQYLESCLSNTLTKYNTETCRSQTNRLADHTTTGNPITRPTTPLLVTIRRTIDSLLAQSHAAITREHVEHRRRAIERSWIELWLLLVLQCVGVVVPLRPFVITIRTLHVALVRCRLRIRRDTGHSKF